MEPIGPATARAKRDMFGPPYDARATRERIDGLEGICGVLEHPDAKITDGELEVLAREAAKVGDDVVADLCGYALAGDANARTICADFLVGIRETYDEMGMAWPGG